MGIVINSNEKKKQQLGMAHGTASNRLRKLILFSLIQKLELDICFQCGTAIEDVSELSIEHKVPWLDSEDPTALFFDLDNIAFSHLKCNVGAARKVYSECGTRSRYTAGCRCDLCKKANTDAARAAYKPETRKAKYKRSGH